MREITKVIVHCSATDDGDDSIDAAIIDMWHKERGWRGIGYHWVICRSGLVESGRSEEEVGAHCKGQNKDSIGICLVGTRDFTMQQVLSLEKLAQGINKRYGLKAKDWFCHYQFVNKDCPNIPVNVVRRLIQNSKKSFVSRSLSSLGKLLK